MLIDFTFLILKQKAFLIISFTSPFRFFLSFTCLSCCSFMSSVVVFNIETFTHVQKLLTCSDSHLNWIPSTKSPMNVCCMRTATSRRHFVLARHWTFLLHFRHQLKSKKLESAQSCKYIRRIPRLSRPHRKCQHRNFSRHCSTPPVQKRMDQRWVLWAKTTTAQQTATMASKWR